MAILQFSIEAFKEEVYFSHDLAQVMQIDTVYVERGGVSLCVVCKTKYVRSGVDSRKLRN
jgi:hypothetical protein